MFNFLKIIISTIFLFSCVSSEQDKLETLSRLKQIANNSSMDGNFEILLVPKEYNLIFSGDKGKKIHKSHIPIKGKYKFIAHKGTSHGTPHIYDNHVFMVMEGEQFIKPTVSNKLVSNDSIVGTLAQILKIDKLKNFEGQVFSESLKANKKTPKIILLFVLDQVGQSYLKANKDSYPFIKSLFKKGLVAKEMHLNYVATSTAVSHAVIGTGRLPKYSGIYYNTFYDKSLKKVVRAYQDSEKNTDVSRLKVNTLADIWDLKQANKPIIFSYAAVPRSAIGMAGHGSSLKGADKDIVFWYGFKKDTFITATNLFMLPKISKEFNFKNYVFENESTKYWLNNFCKPKDGRCLVRSPSFAKLEGMMLFDTLKKQKEIGADDVTDMVMISFKGTDYCGHYFGGESLECGETLKEIDNQISKIYKYLKTKANGSMVTVVTADHGAAPLLAISKGKQLNSKKLKKLLNDKFDKIKRNDIPVIARLNQTLINVNLEELQKSGFKISDVKKYLMEFKFEGELFFENILTFEELK